MRQRQWMTWGLAAGMVLAVAGPSWGQSLSDRVRSVRERRAKAAAAEAAEDARRIHAAMAAKTSMLLNQVELRDAFERWSEHTGVPLLIDWRAMELDGVDESLVIDVNLKDVRADTILLVMMDAASEDLRFVAEVESWGVKLRSRDRANRDVMTRVYDVKDLVMDVPDFTDAPSMDLRDALSNTSSGGGGNAGGGRGNQGAQIFNIEDFSDEDRPLTKQERGDLLIDLVRESIEPDIWRENGGEYSTIKYRNGLMIVRAPLYVHMQIGRAAVSVDPS